MKIETDFCHAIIIPTLKCNFQCVYCYEAHTPASMTPENLAAVALFLSNRMEDVPLVSIGWFGGEPLIEFETIIQFMSRINAEAGTRSARILSDITTNGYFLDSRTLGVLIDHNITRFQVSLDGPQPVHDRSRMLRSGEGTYERIMSNLASARSTTRDFEMVIRVHVSPDNIEAIRVFRGVLESTFGGDARFKFFYRPISRLGGPNDNHLRVFCYSEHEAIVGEFLPKHEVNAYPAPLGQTCYASLPNSFVFLPDYRVGKCTVALQSERNVVGQLNRDGSINIDKERMYEWVKYSIDRSKRIKCPWGELRAAASPL
jgi:uncharacterized protein